jgi:hypothetical protein
VPCGDRTVKIKSTTSIICAAALRNKRPLTRQSKHASQHYANVSAQASTPKYMYLITYHASSIITSLASSPIHHRRCNVVNYNMLARIIAAVASSIIICLHHCIYIELLIYAAYYLYVQRTSAAALHTQQTTTRQHQSKHASDATLRKRKRPSKYSEIHISHHRASSIIICLHRRLYITAVNVQ